MIPTNKMLTRFAVMERVKDYGLISTAGRPVNYIEMKQTRDEAQKVADRLNATRKPESTVEYYVSSVLCIFVEV